MFVAVFLWVLWYNVSQVFQSGGGMRSDFLSSFVRAVFCVFLSVGLWACKEEAPSVVQAPPPVEAPKAVNDTAAKVELPPVDEKTMAMGKMRYEATCQVCHDQGLLAAPKKGDSKEWQRRFLGSENGVETFYQHAIHGFKKMPAQVTPDVSEAEVKAAVDYLLKESL